MPGVPGIPVQVDLAFAISSRARPVDEIGKNRSGSACAHALASRQSARPRVVVIRPSSQVNGASPETRGPLPGLPPPLQPPCPPPPSPHPPPPPPPPPPLLPPPPPPTPP